MIIPVGYGQANFFFTGPNAPRGAQVTLGFKNDAAGSAGDAAATIGAIWVSDIMPDLCTDITLSQVKVKLGPNDTGDENVVSFGTAGSAASQGYSPQVAALITKVTALGGRKGRGRMFLPGLTEGDTDGNGNLNAGTLGSLVTQFGLLYDDLVGADYPPYLLHNDATAPSAILTFNVVQLFGSQRRRIRKVGGRRAA